MQVCRLVLINTLILFLYTLSGCDRNNLKRPVGYFKLGKISDLMQESTDLPEIKIHVHYDEKGFSAMSTACTYDLTPLTRRSNDKGEIWVSSYTSSSYDSKGHVLTGPAKANLPYYDLRVDSDKYGGVKDTLYVEVGVERSEEWRLAIPQSK